MTKEEIKAVQIQIQLARQAIRQIGVNIDEIAHAVNNTTATETAAAQTSDIAPTPQIEPSTVITLEDVRAALTKLASAKGATYVKALLADYNAKKLSDLAPISYEAVLYAAEKELGSE